MMVWLVIFVRIQINEYPQKSGSRIDACPKYFDVQLII
ncbi:hypothetical protein GFC29_1240 [Anoxybacillus sp. B7M1]|jgi:hypothetical protein|nr:hypothetical protein GFC28_384 [Anoxybacillus sp. B2M1]ANB65492.1 hypothetical protein GFC29_1240 [Anoxybacillus sp. B7M1]